MFTALLPIIKKPLDFSLNDNLENKINSVYDYLKIKNIFCEVENPIDIQSPAPINPLQVTEIAVPPGQPAYIKSSLAEYLDILTMEIENYVLGEDSYDKITFTLEQCIRKCQQGLDENNTADDFTFDHLLSYHVSDGKNWHTVMWEHLQFKPGTSFIFTQQFYVRKGFYAKLLIVLSEARDKHCQFLDLSTKPYGWNSKHTELEIAEFIHSIELTHRLKICNGSSSAKFYKQFYALFGITNPMHHQKIQQLRKRVKQSSYLLDLGNAIEKDIVKIKVKSKK